MLANAAKVTAISLRRLLVLVVSRAKRPADCSLSKSPFGVFHIFFVSKLRYLRMSKSKPEVVFVLGQPGAGKGTQCLKIVKVMMERSKAVFLGESLVVLPLLSCNHSDVLTFCSLSRHFSNPAGVWFRTFVGR